MTHRPEFDGPFYDAFAGEIIKPNAMPKQTIATEITFDNGNIARIITSLDNDKISVTVDGLNHVKKVKSERW